MAKAPTADRKGGEDIDSRPVAAEGKPNRIEVGIGVSFFSICLLLACSTKEKKKKG